MYLSPCFWKPECWNCLIVAVVVALARLKRVQESWLLARRKQTLDNYEPAPAGEYLLLIIGQVCPAIWDHLAGTTSSVASQANPASTMRKFLGLHHRESFRERVAGRRLLALRNRLQGPNQHQHQHQHTTLTTRGCLLTRLFIGFIHLPGTEALWRMLLRSADEVKTLWALSGKKVWSYWHQALRQMR